MNEKELLVFRLVELMFKNQQTFLLIDELYEDDIIGTYIRNIQIDSPYQQLLFEGVLSQFSQREELVVCITVENYFHHLLGLILQKDDRYQSSESLIQLIKSNNLKGLKEGVSNLLNLDIELGNFDRITELIDLSDGDETVTGICVTPLVNALLIHGVEKTIEVILENPTENDWKVLFRLDGNLDDLQLHILRRDFLIKLMPNNQLQTKNEVWLGLKAIPLFERQESLKYLSKIDITSNFIQEDKDLLNQLGRLEDNFGNYNKALEYFEKCLIIELKKYDEFDINIAIYYYELGNIFSSLGKYDQSLDYHQKCLAIYLKTYGEEHPFVATSYSCIGNIFSSLGKYDQSLDYHQKCLAIYLKTYGEEHPFVATSYFNIGKLWNSRGNYDKALEYYEKSLAIYLKTYGEEHPSVATSYNDLGNIFSSLGKYNQSLDYHQKCLAIYHKTYGEEHPFVASSYLNIGKLWNSRGNYDKALEYYEKSLLIKIKIYGEEHPSVASSYFNIGKLWNSRGNYDKALEYYEKSLLIKIKIYGEEHPSVATSYNDLGRVFDSKKDYDKSLEYHTKCLSIYLKFFDEVHPFLAISYFNISGVWASKGNYNKALEYLIKSIYIEIKINGSNIKSRLTRFNITIEILEKNEDIELAIENQQKLIEILIDLNFNDLIMIANNYNVLGRLYSKIGDVELTLENWDKALEFKIEQVGMFDNALLSSYSIRRDYCLENDIIEKAIDYERKILEIKSFRNNVNYSEADLFFIVGNHSKDLENYKVAIEILLKAYEIEKKGGFPFIISQCYEALNDKENALDYYIQSSTLRRERIGMDKESTQEAISNTLRLAKELGKENELPVWMKNNN